MKDGYRITLKFQDAPAFFINIDGVTYQRTSVFDNSSVYDFIQKTVFRSKEQRNSP